MHNVRELVAFVFNYDVSRTNAACPGAADFACAQRVEQDQKAAEVVWMFGLYPNQRDLILELAKIVAGQNDRRADPQDMKPLAVVPAVVTDFDNVRLADLAERFGELVVFLSFLCANRIEKRIPDFR